jgi:hypothetical protein
MHIVMDDLIDGEAIEMSAATGQEYFEAWLEHAKEIRSQKGDKYSKEHMPKSWMLLQMIGG